MAAALAKDMKQISAEDLGGVPSGTLFLVAYKYPSDPVCKIRKAEIVTAEPGSEESTTLVQWAQTFVKDTGAVLLLPTNEQVKDLLNVLLGTHTRASSALVSALTVE